MQELVLNTELIIIGLLGVIAAVTWIGNQLPTPYTVGLVLAGLVLTLVPGLTITLPELISELILALFLPPIVFEAAYQMHSRLLVQNGGVITVMTTLGVLISTVAVAVIINGLVPGMGLLVAAVYGALISAIDPVAVIALFRESHTDVRLVTLIEGESLFNDGTAIVIFVIVLAAAITGDGLSLPQGVLDFLYVSLGGLLIGMLIGWGVSRVLYYIDDVLVEMTLTTCLAFGSFLIAEELHVSGVLAVVMAGLMHGHMGFSNMGRHTRETVERVWEYLAYVANAFIFLLIGLTSELADLIHHLDLIVFAIIAVLISRLLAVYALAPLTIRLLPNHPDLPMTWRHVLFWGGQRGAVSLALALSLPETLPYREEIIIMTFGVVLFTSLAQATTMPWLLHRLGLSQPQKPSSRRERPQDDVQSA